MFNAWTHSLGNTFDATPSDFDVRNTNGIAIGNLYEYYDTVPSVSVCINNINGIAIG